MYKRLTRFLPSRYVNHYEKRLKDAGVMVPGKEWSVFFFFYSLSVGLTLTFVLYAFGFTRNALVLSSIVLGVFALLHVLSEAVLIIAESRKQDFIEKNLPEVLTIISSNVRSGVNIEKAIFMSAKKEFGAFAQRIRMAGKKAFFGKTSEESLTELSEGSKSEIVKRAMKLIVEGIKEGSKMSSLLEGIAEDVRLTKSLKEKMRASVSSYLLLFIIANSFGAPLLFALSTYLINAMTTYQQVSEVPSRFGALNIKIPTQAIPKTHIEIIALSALLLNSFFTSLIIGEIEKDDAVVGLKYAIPLMAGSLIVFYAVKTLANTFFGQLIF